MDIEDEHELYKCRASGSDALCVRPSIASLLILQGGLGSVLARLNGMIMVDDMP